MNSMKMFRHLMAKINKEETNNKKMYSQLHKLSKLLKKRFNKVGLQFKTQLETNKSEYHYKIIKIISSLQIYMWAHLQNW